MSENDVSMQIGIAEARVACKGIDGVEARTKPAFKALKHHWCITTEGVQMKAAVAASMMETKSEEERETLARSHRNLSKLSISMQAAMSGMEMKDNNLEDGEMYPLMGWWHDVK